MAGIVRWDSNKELKLSKIDPSQNGGLTDEAAKEKFAIVSAELSKLQELMYAAGDNSVLIVFQGMDTGGKDGAIRNVMGAVNPAGCTVTSFKTPSLIETEHDFLWRIHAATPRKGNFGIFNRSHYEDVLVVRVHNLVPKPVWKKRYSHIVNFERNLVDNDTIILKFFLYISKDEQKNRLLKREADSEKSWKLSVADWKERELWDSYMEAYEEAIPKTSTNTAPWFITPANHKPYRDLLISSAIVEALRPYRENWEKKLVARGKLMKDELAAAHVHEAVKPLKKKKSEAPVQTEEPVAVEGENQA